jgi:hypothetical protein
MQPIKTHPRTSEPICAAPSVAAIRGRSSPAAALAGTCRHNTVAACQRLPGATIQGGPACMVWPRQLLKASATSMLLRSCDDSRSAMRSVNTSRSNRRNEASDASGPRTDSAYLDPAAEHRTSCPALTQRSKTTLVNVRARQHATESVRGPGPGHADGVTKAHAIRVEADVSVA